MEEPWWVHGKESNTTERLSRAHSLSAVNIAAVDFSVHVSFRISVFVFSKYIPRSGMAGSCSGFLNVLRKLYTVSCSGYGSLHSHLQCTRVLFSLNSSEP